MLLIRRSIPVAADVPVALTIGNFDGVHLGHQAMLARLTDAARNLGVAPCVMTFEPHPREFFAPDKAPTRLTSLREKLELLNAAGVERVQICRFTSISPRPRPTILFHASCNGDLPRAGYWWATIFGSAPVAVVIS